MRERDRIVKLVRLRKRRAVDNVHGNGYSNEKQRRQTSLNLMPKDRDGKFWCVPRRLVKYVLPQAESSALSVSGRKVVSRHELFLANMAKTIKMVRKSKNVDLSPRHG